MSALPRSALAFVAAIAIGASAKALPASDPRLVARLAMTAPSRSTFLLHATVPLPSGTKIDLVEHSLWIASHDAAKTRVPAQVEVVSRAPSGDPDVIEVVAPVEVERDAKPGAPVSFALLLGDRAPAAAFREAPRHVELFGANVAGPNDEKASTPRAMRFGLRTKDVFGNLYWASLAKDGDASAYGERVLDEGAWRKRTFLARVMIPRADAPGAQATSGAALPHLLGVHAYVTQSSGSAAIELDLRVHDGLTAASGAPSAHEAPIGAAYFTSLELVVPKGWIVVPEVRDPFFGTPYDEEGSRVFPIVAPLPNGALHMMGPQAQFERRLVIAPIGAGGDKTDAKALLSADSLAFCQRGEDLWSWFDPRTARYFASRDVLASFDAARAGTSGGRIAVRARNAAAERDLLGALESGTARGWYVTSGVLGWAHPWFVKEAGGVGGEGIATLEGHDVAYAASRAGYRYLGLLHRMNVSRQPVAAFRADGTIAGYHAWLDASGTIPFDFRTNGGVVMPEFRLPCKWGAPASDQVRAVVARNLRPPYDQGNWFEKDGSVADSPANLLAWWPHDDQHLVRYTKNAKALVWLGNDAMAKDDLLLAAELYHLMRHESPHVKADWSEGATLLVWERIVAAHPHQGVWFGREDAWGLDAMCAAYSVATPDWRARNRPWFDRMSKLLLDAEQPSGLLQRFVNERLLGHTKYAVAQTFECFFLMHALRCMEESVYRGVDDARRAQLEQLALRGLDYLLWGPPWQRVPNDWQPDPSHPTLYLSGPRQGIAISPNDDYASPPFSDAKRWGPSYLPPDGLGGGVEIFHPWQAIAYASDATQETHGKGLDNRYLKRALDCWTGHASFGALLQDFWQQMNDPSQDNSSNWAGLVGRLQALGAR